LHEQIIKPLAKGIGIMAADFAISNVCRMRTKALFKPRTVLWHV
jgi:hypothetical protein